MNRRSCTKSLQNRLYEIRLNTILNTQYSILYKCPSYEKKQQKHAIHMQLSNFKHTIIKCRDTLQEARQKFHIVHTQVL